MEELLTKPELAKVLKVSVQSIQIWKDQGMPHVLLGKGTYRYRVSEVLDWFQARQTAKQDAEREGVKAA